MPAHNKVFVSIYCKIFTDNFSEEMVDRLATGNEIYEFLMKDAGQCFDESGNPLPGDCNLWYLGCNEKFGHLALDDKVWNWGFGESSFDNAEAIVSSLYQKKLISGVQFHSLMAKIDEGRLIDNMYLIGDYLTAQRDEKPWTQDPNSAKFRDNIKRMTGGLGNSFENKGYLVFL